MEIAYSYLIMFYSTSDVVIQTDCVNFLQRKSARQDFSHRALCLLRDYDQRAVLLFAGLSQGAVMVDHHLAALELVLQAERYVLSDRY